MKGVLLLSTPFIVCFGNPVLCTGSQKKSTYMNFSSNTRRYPLHLCQPDGAKSCGACCGLYNWEDHSRETLESLLGRRTELFFSLGETPDLEKYHNLSQPLSPSPKLCEDIYNCEFLGFVDGEHKRVGCLLHPALHHSVDLRECSFYGAKLCGEHFCSSFTYLTRMEQEAVVCSLDDWYLYGLVITDIDLVKTFFTHVQNCLGDCVRVKRLRDVGVQVALHDFFRLKEYWKFVSGGKRLGKYYFSNAEYRIARVEYERNLRVKPSRFDKIFLSLASAFKTEDDIIEAESIIEERITKFIEAYL